MNKKYKKRILVTGGAGFIGSHLCKRLSKEGNEVISLDNYFTGLTKNHVDGIRYIEGETKDINSLIKERIDVIYHLGEYSRVLTSFDDIDLVFRLNIIGTFNVLEFCKKNNTRLIYAGSSTKFGEFDNAEDGQNQSPYAYFKSTNTDLVNNYGKWFGLDYAITYFYNVYGEGEIREGKYATVIGIFTTKYKNNKALTVTNPGTQKRSFTHIKDTIDGLILVGKNGKGDGYCIGSEETFSILEIAEMFGGKIQMLPEKKGDRKYSKINLKKMQGLDWSAKEDLKDYISSIKNSG